MSSPGWLGRLRRLLRPPRTLKVTPAGRTFLVLTIGIGLGALNTGNNLLYLVLGVQLAVVVVSGVLSERVLRSVEVQRIGAEAAFAGEPFPFRWAVRAGRGPLFALALAEADVPLEGEAKLGFLPAGEDRVVRGKLVAPRRGPFALSAVKVTTVYPLGLFAKSRLLPLEGELLVFPRRRTAGARAPEQAGQGEGALPRPFVEGQGDPAGLRPLREGEDARGIHWAKSAASPVLLKVEREQEAQRVVELELKAGAGPPAALDRRCEELAAQANALLGRGVAVGLITPGRRLRPGGGPAQASRVLRALALAGYEEA